MKQYYQNLKSHPGVPVALLMTVLYIHAGISRKDASVLTGICIALVPSLVTWLIVLVTNYTNNK